MKKFILMMLTLLQCTLVNQGNDFKKNELESLSLDEKVGMLFIIQPEALIEGFNMDTPVKSVQVLNDEMKQFYKQYPSLGFILFSGNIKDEKQLKTLTKQLHDLNENVLVCVDEEGGDVSRLANTKALKLPVFSNMASYGKQKDEDKAYQIGYQIGSYLKDYGFDLDLAPVCDVNTNPKNIVIGERSFGSDPSLVSKMIASEIRGFHDASMMTCLKHFPGHGDTMVDTHLQVACVNKSWDELLNSELLPFLKGMNEKSDMIMLGHIQTPQISHLNVPASLSYDLVKGKLRDVLNYQGLIITDSFQMASISSNYSVEQACVRAILAGVDIILMPADYQRGFMAVKKAVELGIIDMKVLDEHVLRIKNHLERRVENGSEN